MVFLAVIAILGAALGGGMRPRLLGAVLAMGLAGGLRGLIGLVASGAVDNLRAPVVSQFCLSIVQSAFAAYPLVLSVAAGAALLAALLLHLVDDHGRLAQRRVRKGRYVRAPHMIEERPVQKAAEARQKALLDL